MWRMAILNVVNGFVFQNLKTWVFWAKQQEN